MLMVFVTINDLVSLPVQPDSREKGGNRRFAVAKLDRRKREAETAGASARCDYVRSGRQAGSLCITRTGNSLSMTDFAPAAAMQEPAARLAIGLWAFLLAGIPTVAFAQEETETEAAGRNRHATWFAPLPSAGRSSSTRPSCPITLRPGDVWTQARATRSQGPLRDRAVLECQRGQQRRQCRGHIVERINRIILGATADQGRQDPAESPFAATDLHAFESAPTLRGSSSSTSDGAFRRHGRAEDGGAFAEPRRYHVRDR